MSKTSFVLRLLQPLATAQRLPVSIVRISIPLLGAFILFAEVANLTSEPRSSHCVTVTVSPTTTTLLPMATQQFLASVTCTANTGVTWSVSPATGTISNTGVYTPGSITSQQSVTVRATSVADSSKYAQATVTLVPPLKITTAALPSGNANVQYSVNLAAMGGTTPYTWYLVSGTLPPGLTLTNSPGTVSGTPNAVGSYAVTLQTRDALGEQVSQPYSVSIANSVPWGPTYYVSGQNGNDTWSGLLPAPNSTFTDGPFKTLAKAQSAIRVSSTIKAATLRGGLYSVPSGWQLNWEDDGELWIPYPGEIATLDGGGTRTMTLTGASNVSFKGLTIQNLGPGGLYINGGSNSIAIRWNAFYNCIQSCVSGGNVTNSIIDSNVLNGQNPGNPSGSTSSAYSAIMLWYGSSNNQITHNLIENCQGGGIDFSAGAADPPNNNNLVDRNILQNVNTNVIDSGAIYMSDRSHSAVGNQITNNLVNGNGGTNYLTNWTKAFYLDDLMSNVVVSGNICRNCGEFAWQIHAGDHNVIENNIFDLSPNGTHLGLYQNSPILPDYGMLGNHTERNLIYFGNSVPASLYQVNIGSADAMPYVANQLYYSVLSATIPNGKTIIDLSPIYANPQFTNPTGDDYSMPSTSPAYTWVLFQQLPTNLGPLPYAP